MYGIRIPDGVVTLKIGEMGFILTKKIFIGIILFIVTALMLYYRLSNLSKFGHSHHNEVSKKK
jgi:hypothetical protein